MYGERLARWERAVEWPLVATACLFLIAYATQILAHPDGVLQAVAEGVIWVTWGLFLGDYAVRLTIAEHRWRWFSRHLLDLAIVVLPILRPLRLMRFLTILALIQRGAGARFRGKVVIYTVGATILTIVVAGLAVLDAEEGNGGPIQSFGDAVWWAFVTITTVGYGDYVPVTVTGRIVAVALMIGGIALIGVVTATIASWIVQRVSIETESADVASEAQVAQLRAEIGELKGELSEMKEMIRDLRPVA
ncbi:MAG: ion channel [Microbacterium sp.]|uniref:potassium channel family protein n=1 Tax=Microbacterium sp. TaxID=51671 RepID=UPI0039E3F7A0